MPIRNLDDLRKYLSRPTEDEAEKAFTTYKNFLVHIDRCLGGVYGVGTSLLPGVVSEVRSAKKYRAI